MEGEATPFFRRQMKQTNRELRTTLTRLNQTRAVMNHPQQRPRGHVKSGLGPDCRVGTVVRFSFVQSVADDEAIEGALVGVSVSLMALVVGN